ncbi:MAG: hypothetical protein Q9162_002591 [Coniocarpon cinnabarinum]
MSVATEVRNADAVPGDDDADCNIQPPSGFTAVNGRSPPTWSDRAGHHPSHPAPMENNLFAHARPDQPSSFQPDDSESRKRKRDDGDSGSPHSNTSHRQHAPPPHSSASSETLPPITSAQPNGAPYATQEPNAHLSKPPYTSSNAPSQWHQPRSTLDDNSTETRLMEVLDRNGPQHQPNGNYQIPQVNGNPSHPMYNQPPPHQQPPPPPPPPHNDQQQPHPPPPPGQEPPGQPGQTLPGMTAPNIQKQRKRNFANRTKTGCLTCRERKKKCDETKPMCTNCQRGGFECKGYSQTHQLRGSMQPTLVQKPDGPPFAVHGSSPYTAAPFPPSTTMFYPQPPEPPDHSRPPMPARDDPTRAFIDPNLPPNYSRGFADPHMSPFASEPMRPEFNPAMTTMPDFSRDKAKLPPPNSMSLSSSIGPNGGSYARGSPQNMAQLALSSNSHMRTEKEKMLNQHPFNPDDPTLKKDRQLCAKFVYLFNKGCADPENLSHHEQLVRFRAILEGHEPHSTSPRNGPDLRAGLVGQSTEIQAPFFCDYGFNVRIGENTEIGRNCTMLDACTVTIGRNCYIGPDVKFYTQTADTRNAPPKMGKRLAVAKPIVVEDDVWIGGACIIYGGVSIGAGAFVAAGCVVQDSIRCGIIVQRKDDMRHATGAYSYHNTSR